jgi:hypothetical protein
MIRIFIPLTLVLVFCGCSMEKRCARAAKKCSDYWIQQPPDTILTIDTVKIPGASTQLTFDCDTIHDTVKISEGNATLTLWRDSSGRMNADCNCDDTFYLDTGKVIRVPTPSVPVEVTPKWVNPTMWVLSFVSFLIGYHFCSILKRKK